MKQSFANKMRETNFFFFLKIFNPSKNPIFMCRFTRKIPESLNDANRIMKEQKKKNFTYFLLTEGLRPKRKLTTTTSH